MNKTALIARSFFIGWRDDDFRLITKEIIVVAGEWRVNACCLFVALLAINLSWGVPVCAKEEPKVKLELLQMQWQHEKTLSACDEEAKGVAESLVKLRKERPASIFEIVMAIRACAKAGRFESAERVLKAALQLDGLTQLEYNDLILAKAYLSAQMEDTNSLKECIDDLNRKPRSSVNQKSLCVMKSYYSYLIRKFDAAEKYAREALSENTDAVQNLPYFLDAKIELGNALFAQEKYLQAVAAYLRALKSNDIHWYRSVAGEISSYLALCYAHTGNIDFAEYQMHGCTVAAQSNKPALLSAAQTYYNASLLTSETEEKRAEYLKKAQEELTQLNIKSSSLAKSVNTALDRLTPRSTSQ